MTILYIALILMIVLFYWIVTKYCVAADKLHRAKELLRLSSEAMKPHEEKDTYLVFVRECIQDSLILEEK